MSERATIEQAIRENGFFVRTFRGHSMMPMLDEKKDAVRLIPVSGRLKKYDIPLYIRKDEKLILHRIIKVLENGYVIRGDNCIQKEYVSEDQIIAVTEGIYKDGIYHGCTEKCVARFAVRQRRTLLFRILHGKLSSVKRKLVHILKRMVGKNERRDEK